MRQGHAPFYPPLTGQAPLLLVHLRLADLPRYITLSLSLYIYIYIHIPGVKFHLDGPGYPGPANVSAEAYPVEDYYNAEGLPVSWVFVWNTGGVFALSLVRGKMVAVLLPG